MANDFIKHAQQPRCTHWHTQKWQIDKNKHHGTKIKTGKLWPEVITARCKVTCIKINTTSNRFVSSIMQQYHTIIILVIVIMTFTWHKQKFNCRFHMKIPAPQIWHSHQYYVLYKFIYLLKIHLHRLVQITLFEATVKKLQPIKTVSLLLTHNNNNNNNNNKSSVDALWWHTTKWFIYNSQRRSR